MSVSYREVFGCDKCGTAMYIFYKMYVSEHGEIKCCNCRYQPDDGDDQWPKDRSTSDEHDPK